MKPEEYILLDKVYGNYISFQERIIPIINTYKANTEINVLEIGCGTGITSELLLRYIGNIKLTTIDIDDKMIEFAKQTLSSYTNINFIVSDAISFVEKQKSNSLDFIVSAFTIHNLPSEYRQQLYKELYRILKADGLFINADKFVSDNKEEQIEGLKYRIGTYIDTLVRENKMDLLKEWTTHYIDDFRPEKLLQFDVTINDLKHIGFDKVDFVFKSKLEMLGLLIATK
jgi:ubiquinone/menaquinone biosynthesis C-methylase UbiE